MVEINGLHEKREIWIEMYMFMHINDLGKTRTYMHVDFPIELINTEYHYSVLIRWVSSR